MQNIRKNNYIFASALSIVVCAGLYAKSVPVRKSVSPVQEINSAQEFTTLLPKGRPVVAQFYNTECPVCQRFEASGIYRKLAEKYTIIPFVKIEKKLKNLHKKYKITGYPTFIFFKDGTQVKKFSGAASEKQLEDIIESTLLENDKK